MLASVSLGNGVASIGDGAFQNCGLKTVIVPESVNSIGNSVFSGCKNLTDITLGNGIASIGEGSFQNCGKLVSVSIPQSVTYIGANAFAYCASLKSINIPEGVTSIENNTFASCSNLSSVMLPTSLTEIGSYAFIYCNSLTSVNIPENVKEIGIRAFYQCGKLESVTIADGVAAIGDEAFCDCTSLVSIDIPEKLTEISKRSFSGCKNLYSVTIPSGVSVINENAFYGCNSLGEIYCNATVPPTCGAGCFSGVDKALCNLYVAEGSESAYLASSEWRNFLSSFNEGDFNFSIISSVDKTVEVIARNGKYSGNIIIPETAEKDGVIYTVTSIGDDVFSDCYSLESVSIPAAVVKIGSRSFKNCTGLKSIVIPDGVASIGSEAFSGCSNIAFVNIPDGVTSIGSSAFSGCSKLASVSFGSGITSIGNSCFRGCTSLSSVTIPDRVTSIGSLAFAGCSKLASVSFGSGLKTIGESAFASCDGLTTITIPDGATSVGKAAFSDCKNLKAITLSNSLTTLGNNAFASCISLETVAIPDNIFMVGDSTFYKCSALETVSLGSGVISIGKVAFQECTNLATINIPDGVMAVGMKAFLSCTSLPSIVIPDKVAVLSDSIFYNCTGLTSVTIGKGLTSVKAGAFQGCTGLAEINSLATTPPECASFCFYNVDKGNCTLNIPEGTEETYGAANEWKEFLYEKYFTVDNVNFAITSSENKTVEVVTGTYSGDVIIPLSVELEGIKYDVVSIGNYAFNNCTELKSVAIPKNVTYIGDYAFNGCTALTQICDFAVFPQTLGDYCFNGVKTESCNLYVPEYPLTEEEEEAEEKKKEEERTVPLSYKKTAVWKNFETADKKIVEGEFPSVYNMSIYSVYVNGTRIIRNSEDKYAAPLQCGEQVAQIEITLNAGDSEVEITTQDGEVIEKEDGATANTYAFDTGAGGRYDLNVTVISKKVATKTYILSVCKLPADIIQKKWDDVLVVVNNPDNNGGFEFDRYKWLVNGLETVYTDQYMYLPGGVSTTDSYSVELTTTDGITLTSCPWQAPTEGTSIRLYPTVVSCGGDMTLSMEGDSMTDGQSTIYISDMNGRTTMKQVSGKNNTIVAPDAQGTYIVNVVTPDKEKTEFKIIVKE